MAQFCVVWSFLSGWLCGAEWLWRSRDEELFNSTKHWIPFTCHACVVWQSAGYGLHTKHKIFVSFSIKGNVQRGGGRGGSITKRVWLRGGNEPLKHRFSELMDKTTLLKNMFQGHCKIIPTLWYLISNSVTTCHEGKPTAKSQSKACPELQSWVIWIEQSIHISKKQHLDLYEDVSRMTWICRCKPKV